MFDFHWEFHWYFHSILLFLMVCLILYLVINYTDSDPGTDDYCTHYTDALISPITPDSNLNPDPNPNPDPKLIPDSNPNPDPDSSKSIHISKSIYDKMVEIVTNYSMMSNDDNEKVILIYLATFHLFDMNYGQNILTSLDTKITSYPYYPNNIQFPKGNIYHNLQKAIITHITLQITDSERKLVHDKNKDHLVIDIYLSNLFQGIGII